MLTVVDRDSIVVTEQSRVEAGRVVDDLPDHALARLMVVAGNRKPQPIPPELAKMLTRVLRTVARGGSVTIASMPDELTTTSAADELGISRPTLMKMIREGEIPAHKVGTHHRLKTADVREFRKGQLKQQRAAFENLLALENETVPYAPGLEDLLDRYLQTRHHRYPTHFRRSVDTGPWVGLLKRGQPLLVDRRGGDRLQRGGLQYLVHSAYRTAGIDSARARGALVHALRHTFATRLIDTGASAVEVMELLGHQSLATTQQYVKASAREIRAAAAANPIYQDILRIQEADTSSAHLDQVD